MSMEIDYEKMWEEIISETESQTIPIQSGEMSVRMFCDRSNLSYRWARELLEKRVSDGRMTKRFAKINGHRVLVYKPVPSSQ